MKTKDITIEIDKDEFKDKLDIRDGINGKDGKDGKNGKDGEKGEIGDKPDHKWNGTKLAFEKPNGEWGKEVDLLGKSGAIYQMFGGGGSTDLSSYLKLDQTTPQTTVGRFVFPDIAVDTNLIYTDSTNNRVGIGTTNPNDKLDVMGKIRSTTDNSSYANFYAVSNGGQYPRAFYGIKGNTGYDNVGFTVANDSNDSTERRSYFSASTLTNAAAAIAHSIVVQINPTYGEIYAGQEANSGNLPLYLYSGSNNRLNGLTISPVSSSGESSINVGIGTTNPGSPLEISKNTGAATKTLLTLTYSNVLNAGGSIDFNTSPSFPMGKIESVTDVSNSASLRFYTRNNGPLVEWMRITGAGNVGIGTTNPEARLTVGSAYTEFEYDGFKSVNSPNTLAVQSGADTYYRWLGGSYGSASTLNFDLANTISKDKGIAGTGFRLTSGNGTGGTNNGYLAFSSLLGNINETYAASEVMRITSNGNVGIGTSTPNATLQVVGNSHFGEDTTNYSEFESDGTLILHGTATTYEDLTSPALALKVKGTGIKENSTENTMDFQTTADYSDDYLYTNFQMSHTKELDTRINLHIHWEQTENKLPNFLFEYRWQSQCNEKTTAWTKLPVTTSACTFSGTTLNQISYGEEISVTEENLSDILQIRLYRDTANDSGSFSGVDTYTTTAKVVFIDVHYRRDSLGSRDEFNK